MNDREAIEGTLTQFLCDKAWEGKWNFRGEKNVRPRAHITAVALSPIVERLIAEAREEERTRIKAIIDERYATRYDDGPNKHWNDALDAILAAIEKIGGPR